MADNEHIVPLGKDKLPEILLGDCDWVQLPKSLLFLLLQDIKFLSKFNYVKHSKSHDKLRSLGQANTQLWTRNLIASRNMYANQLAGYLATRHASQPIGTKANTQANNEILKPT